MSMTLLATAGLELLAYQIQSVQACITQTGKGKPALRHFLKRRKAIIRRWKLAPFYVVSDN